MQWFWKWVKAIHWGYWVMAGLALGIRLCLAWQPMERLLVYTVADDMFYYLELAARWVAGQGVSFDGLTQTNGFHPLYFLLCSGMTLFRLPDTHLVHCLLTLSSIWAVLTAGLMAMIVNRLVGHSRFGLLAFTLYALNPFIIALDLNGMETSLYGLCLVFAFSIYLGLRTAREVRWGEWMALGAAVGVTFLARTEGVFLPLVMLMDTLWLTGSRAVPRSRWVLLGLTGAIALLIAAPWLGWNVKVFGTIQQASGAIFPYRAQRIFEAISGRHLVMLDYAKEMLRSFGWNIYILGNMMMGIPYTAPKNILLFFVLVPAFIGGFLVGKFRWNWQRFRGLGVQFGFGGLYLLFMFGYYTFYHRASHWRYFYSMVMVLIPGLIIFLESFGITLNGRKNKAGWILAGLSVYLLLGLGVLIVKEKSYPAQLQMFQAARWMDEQLPPTARVGAFNAGIYGFWSGRQVINLDGVTNNEILETLRTNTLWDYVVAKKIEYICDGESAVKLFLKVFAPNFRKENLSVVMSFPGKDEAVCVYKVEANKGKTNNRQ